jgi:Domain of unknown function (DUF4266)
MRKMNPPRGLFARGLVLALTLLATAGVGCAIVPQNRRKHLADPMMSFEADTLDAHKRQKFYSTREAAAGGDGVPAGGGCGCQ